MIVRPTATHLLLIAQPDHAALAARIMACWRRDGFPARPTHDVVLEAVRQHDIGWTSEDAAPRLDPSAGGPYDFISAPAEIRQRLWPRALTQMEPRSPYVAALIAQHARTVYRRYDDDPVWQAFLDRMAGERDRLLGLAAETSHGTFQEDYAIVSIGDLLSLIVCNAWTEPHEMGGYRAELRDDRLEVRPDPFDGALVDVSIRARQIPRQAYRTALDLLDAFRSAPIVTLTGDVAGKD